MVDTSQDFIKVALINALIEKGKSDLFPDMSQPRLYRHITLSLLTHSLTTVNKIYYCQ